MKIIDPFSYLLVRMYVNRYIKNLKVKKVVFKEEALNRIKNRAGVNVSFPDGDTVYVTMDEIYGESDK